jgi:hypothetical protein
MAWCGQTAPSWDHEYCVSCHQDTCEDGGVATTVHHGDGTTERWPPDGYLCDDCHEFQSEAREQIRVMTEEVHPAPPPPLTADEGQHLLDLLRAAMGPRARENGGTASG